MFTFRASKTWTLISELKSKAKALWHLKVDPDLKIDATFHNSQDLCDTCTLDMLNLELLLTNV